MSERLSRSQVGVDEAPVVQDMQRSAPLLRVQSSHSGGDAAVEVSVQPLTMELVEGLRQMHNEGFGSKRCCLCRPVADNDGRIAKFYTNHAERLPMCGIAVGKDNTPLGFVQLAIHPMNDKDGLHTTKPGETYIEQIGVGAAARGKGIGKLLLQWAEDQAREHHHTTLTLSVLNGNPARRLYERFGFQGKKQDECDQCIVSCIVCCLVGRPYDLCNPHCGAVDMSKSLLAYSLPN